MGLVLDIGTWRVEADPDATRAGYEALGPKGSADGCPCYPCQNFRVARASAYPSEFLDVLNTLGVNPRCEDDVSDFGPSDDNAHEDYVQGRRGGWQDWKWTYQGEFLAFGRASQVRKPPKHKGLKCEVEVGPTFS